MNLEEQLLKDGQIGHLHVYGIFDCLGKPVWYETTQCILDALRELYLDPARQVIDVDCGEDGR